MKKRMLWLLLLPTLVGCETLGPTLTRLAVAIGQDLIAAASVNHSPRYAVQLEQLLIALTSQATGLQMQGQLANTGYQPPPPNWAMQQQTYGGYQQATSANTPGYSTPGYNQNEYSQAEYDQNQYSQDQNGQDQYADDQSVYQQYEYDNYDPQTYQQVLTRSARSIQFKTTLLARRSGSQGLVEVNEGDVLVDGGTDPAQGDLLKVHFQTNCACYVYVIGIDATGFVATLYPDPDANHTNPVQPGESYLLPGQGEWWGLDQQKGVEQVIFLASRTPREDLEENLAVLGSQTRDVAADYQSVTELALPATRGLVKVKAEPLQLQGQMPQEPIHPSLFTTQNPGNEIIVTRWFYHQ